MTFGDSWDMSKLTLDSSVLVLNSSLVAVDLTTARRAFCLLCKAVAEVVDVSDGGLEFHGFESWQEINVSLPEIAAAGVDLNSVSYMGIGIGDGTDVDMSSSKWDIIYIDDIALYPPE